jgi:hypothetical protein
LFRHDRDCSGVIAGCGHARAMTANSPTGDLTVDQRSGTVFADQQFSGSEVFVFEGQVQCPRHHPMPPASRRRVRRRLARRRRYRLSRSHLVRHRPRRRRGILFGHLCAATQHWAEAVTLWAAYHVRLQDNGTVDVYLDALRRQEPIQKPRKRWNPAGCAQPKNAARP